MPDRADEMEGDGLRAQRRAGRRMPTCRSSSSQQPAAAPRSAQPVCSTQTGANR